MVRRGSVELLRVNMVKLVVYISPDVFMPPHLMMPGHIVFWFSIRG